ncbi:MAG: transglutaminase domain-containing protein [Candidatus Brocadiia bacterium]
MGQRGSRTCAAAAAALIVFMGIATMQARADELEPVPNVVTADIEAGIKQHINQKTEEGDGYFNVPWRDSELALKLVRVHTEYLANLGPRLHFACVDLVDTEGDVYDVDFFLAGDPGEMRVTETTVHKINGQPIYLWEQKPDGTWHRVPPEEGSDELRGVVRGRDEFDFRYRARLPQIDGPARLWMPIAASDRFQDITVLHIIAPADYRVLTDPDYGNRVMFMQLGPEHSGEPIELLYHVVRIEKAAYVPEGGNPMDHLRPERLVPLSETFRKEAEEVTAGMESDLVRARALYDRVIERMSYIKHGEGWGQGNAVYACDVRTGNCTDFHSYFMALARSVGIPARFAIGAGIPASRDDGGVDGYHCWVEFYADGKWWPVDISEGDKFSSLSTYYFGHHPANRLELSRGRDLRLEPGPESGPINFLAYPLLEVEGEPVKVETQFSFDRPGTGD